MNQYECRKEDGDPTDWLMLLPQSTLVDVMLRRCRALGGIVSVAEESKASSFKWLTPAQVMKQEFRIKV